MVKQQQDSWWSRRKKAKKVIRESRRGVYEEHASWKAFRALSRKHGRWSLPLGCLIVVACAWGMAKHGLGVGAEVSARVGSNLSMIGIVWVLMAVLLVRVFRSLSLSSYSKEFRQEARNLMARTADPDPGKRWNTAQLVKHLSDQISNVPQDGVILTTIIQQEQYSFTALIDAAERAKAEGVLKIVLDVERQNMEMNGILFALSAVLSGLVCRWALLLMKNISGKDPLVSIGLAFFVLALIVLSWSLYKGQDPEKWISALVKIFIGFVLLVGAGLGYIKLVDVLRENQKPEASKRQEVQRASTSSGK